MFSALVILLLAALIWSRAFGTRPIGLADNGDFPKILGRICAWPADGKEGHQFRYFVTDYVINPADPWNSHLPTVELWVAKVARNISDRALTPPHFDLRFIGVMHALFLIAAGWAFLRWARPLAWPWTIAIAALILVMLADLEYLEFLTTAYMDAGSIYALVLLTSLAIGIAGPEQNANWKTVICFSASAAWFLGSKIQHEPALIPLLLFCGYYLSRARTREVVTAWIGALLLLVSTTLYMEIHMPPDYEAESRFSLTFLKLIPLSSEPLKALAELGLSPDDLKYNTMHAWSAGSPLTNTAYRDRFWRDVTKSRVIRYYVRHPKTAGIILSRDLRKAGADIPVSEIPVGLATRTYTQYGLLRRSDDPVPNTRRPMLNPWSSARRFIASHYPWTSVLLYMVCIAVGLWRLRYPSRNGVNYWPIILLLCSIGVLSFLTGSLADATDTSRHTVTYQVSTDLILLCLVYQAAFRSSRRVPHSDQPPSGPAV